MPRPRLDGTPQAPPNKQKLNQLFLTRLKPQERPSVVWDTHQRGLVLRVRPTGQKAWNVIYTRHSRPHWYYLGDATAVGLADARLLASRIMFQVAEGKDPAAERKALRSKGTFAELAHEFVERYAKKKTKHGNSPTGLCAGSCCRAGGNLKPPIFREPMSNQCSRASPMRASPIQIVVAWGLPIRFCNLMVVDRLSGIASLKCIHPAAPVD